MRTWMLAAGAAALAITAPALADPRGGGQGGGKGNAAKVERGGDRGGQAKAARRGGDRDRGQARSFRGSTDRAGQARFAQGERRGAEERRARADRDDKRAEQRRARAENARGRGDLQRAARVEQRGDDRRAVRAARIEQRGDRRLRARGDDRVVRGERDAAIRELRRDRVRDRARFVESDRVFRVRDLDRGKVRFRDIDRDDLFARRIGWANGCPPGLAKKPVACVPPGQAAKYVGQPLNSVARLAAFDPLPRSLRSLYYDDDEYYYRYGGGYLYRVDRDNDLISSLIPLFGAALIGQPLSASYVNPYRTPSYFSSFYPNSPYDCYRYGYGYVYETDCVTGRVEDVIPTYDYGYGVGQVLPASYSYYNVPYAYRGYYPDDDDYYYRYAPGAIYRVDRETSLISAVASLLTGGLTVGQPLPMGYSTYNVPMAYRSSYYDTPDMWYRYNNGYIYSVDPTTQLVTAIVRAIV